MWFICSLSLQENSVWGLAAWSITFFLNEPFKWFPGCTALWVDLRPRCRIANLSFKSGKRTKYLKHLQKVAYLSCWMRLPIVVCCVTLLCTLFACANMTCSVYIYISQWNTSRWSIDSGAGRKIFCSSKRLWSIHSFVIAFNRKVVFKEKHLMILTTKLLGLNYLWMSLL